MTDVPRCPLCGTDSPVKLVTRDLNRNTSPESFCYNGCTRCGLIFIPDQPQNMAAYYPLGYVTPPPSVADLQRIAGKTLYQLELLQRFATKGRLLEIGPGYGAFLWQAKAAGFNVQAIEADASACEYVARVVGAHVLESDSPAHILSTLAEPYDAIVLWHAIEHLPDPWATLREAVRLLTADGVLIIATPNPSAWQFRLLRSRWPHIDAPRHLWLIPLDVVREYLQTLGMGLLFVTTGDSGGRSWDRFGWSQALLNVLPRFARQTLVAKIVTRLFGHAVALVVRPWERGHMKGSAYTAVFQKR